MFVIRRYCSGLYNVAVSYIGVSVVAEPNAQYSQASAVRVVVCIKISIHLYSFTALQLTKSSNEQFRYIIKMSPVYYFHFELFWHKYYI